MLGAPQGSPLSPFLWNLIISELLNKQMPENTTIQALADDITLLIKGKSRSSLEKEAESALNIVYDWSIKNKLTFSNDKCEFINIGAEYKNRPPVIKLGNKSMKRVTQMKTLGVIFDNKLSFIPHLKEVKKKVINITAGFLKFSSIQGGMSPKQLRQIYIRSIERTIDYGSPIWY